MEGIICSDLGFISRVYIQSYLNCCFMSEDFGPLLVSMTKRINLQLLIVELATTVENLFDLLLLSFFLPSIRGGSRE